MAEDIIQNIVINAVGGDGASAQIDQVNKSFQDVNATHDVMKSKFQERFQHIGLQLFVGDAMRASGLGAETRMVISGLNSALMAGETAFGAAAGPALLFATALIAVGGIAAKIIEHHKNMADSLDKLVSSQQSALSSTQDDIAVLTRYNEVVGGAGGLLASEKALAALQQGELLESERQQVAAIKDLMESNITHAKVMSLLEDAYHNFVSVFTISIKAVLEAIPGVGILVDIYDLLKNKISTATTALHMHGIEYGVNAGEAKKLADENTKLQVKMDQLLFSIQHGGQAWKDNAKSANDNFKEVEDAMVKEQEDYDKAMAKIDADTKKTLDEMAKAWQTLTPAAKRAADEIGNDFGNMANQMIFQQQTLTQALDNLWRQMAQQFITYVAKMITEALMLRAVMSGMFGGVPGMMPAEIAGSGADITGGGSNMMASGGTLYADRPTLAIFGEAGPEKATFTPLSGGGGSSSGGGGDTYNVQLVMNANGVTDPDTLARTMGQKLVQMIRGQGQLNMSR